MSKLKNLNLNSIIVAVREAERIGILQLIPMAVSKFFSVTF